MPQAPSIPDPHRRRRRRVALVALALLWPSAVACGEVAEDAEPTIPSIDFTPTLVLVLDDGDVVAEDGGRDGAAVSLDPPTVVGGSVVEVRNEGAQTARLRAGSAFDTGSLEPGERTVVVLVNDGDDARRWPLDDGSTSAPPDGDEGPLGTLVVEPRPAG